MPEILTFDMCRNSQISLALTKMIRKFVFANLTSVDGSRFCFINFWKRNVRFDMLLIWHAAYLSFISGKLYNIVCQKKVLINLENKPGGKR